MAAIFWPGITRPKCQLDYVRSIVVNERFLDNNVRSRMVGRTSHRPEDRLMDTRQTTTTRDLPFRASVEWESFDELAKQVGSAGLRRLEPGTVAHLRVKQDAFVVTREEDFQRVVGLASDAARLQHMVETLVNGIEMAAAKEDPKLLSFISRVARQLAESLQPSPSRLDLLMGWDDEDRETAPRSAQQLATAHGG